MTATSTTTPVVAQTNIYNANPQYSPWLERFYKCSLCLICISFVFIFAGVANILMGVLTFGNFYDSLPEKRKSDLQIQRNAGIAVFVIGIILLTLSIAWCCYSLRHLSNIPTTFSETTMTPTAVAPNAAYTPGIVYLPLSREVEKEEEEEEREEAVNRLS